MNESVPSDPIDKNTKWNKIPQIAWFTLFILGSVDLISTAGETMIIPAIPDIINEFNITYSDSSWILSSYLIAGAVMTPVASKLSIIFGKKEILLTLMILYVIGTLLAGFAMNFSFLIVARVIQGLGVAMFPLAFSIIQTVFPKESLAIGQGIIIALFSSGSVIGLVIGGYVIDNFGWQTIFFVFVPISILTIILINKKINIPDENILINENTESIDTLTNKKLSKLNLIDFKGTITLALLISSFLIVLSNLKEFDPRQFQFTVIFTIITLISLMLFIFFSKRNKNPVISLGIFKQKILLFTNIILMISGLTTLMIYQMLPILIRNPFPVGFEGDAIKVVEIQFPFMIVLFLVSVCSGFLVSKLGNIKPTLLGSVISLLGFFSIFFFHFSEFVIVVNLVIIGIGISFLQVGGFNIITTSTPKKLTEISVGVTSLLFIIGMSIGPVISSLFLQNFKTLIYENNNFLPSSEAYNLIFLTAASISLVPTILILYIKKIK